MIDELNTLIGQGPGAILGAVSVLLAWFAVRFIGRESKRDDQEAKEHTTEAEVQKLYLSVLKNLIDSQTATQEAQATTADQQAETTAILKQMRADYEDGKQHMLTVTAQRDKQIKTGFDTLQSGLDAVPSRVGEITEPQIDTIRATMATLLNQLEVRIETRIDQAVGSNSETVLSAIKTEFQELSGQIMAQIDKLIMVPEEIKRLACAGEPSSTNAPQLADSANPQTAEPGAEGKG